MLPRKEVAVVWRGGGRRWFSFESACKAEIKSKLRGKCECSHPEYENGFMIYPGDVCKYHQDDYYKKLMRRMMRLYEKAAKLDAPTEHQGERRP